GESRRRNRPPSAPAARSTGSAVCRRHRRRWRSTRAGTPRARCTARSRRSSEAWRPRLGKCGFRRSWRIGPGCSCLTTHWLARRRIAGASDTSCPRTAQSADMYTIVLSRKVLPAAPGPGILAAMVLAESPSLVTAVLGPTNTGKTHLAIERLLGHESGMIGFPLRLLARENYDRLVAAKGARAVA